MKNIKTTIAFLYLLCAVSVQLSAQCILACTSPQTTISTELDGTIEITISDLLVVPADPDCGPISITVTDAFGALIESDTTTFTVDIANGPQFSYEISYGETGNSCWSWFTLVQGNGGCNLACQGIVDVITEEDNTAEIFVSDLLLFSSSNCTDLSILVEGANNSNYSLSSMDESIILDSDDDEEFIYTITDVATGNSCWGGIILTDACPMVCNEVINITSNSDGLITLNTDILFEGLTNCSDVQIDVVGSNSFTASGLDELTIHAENGPQFDYTVTNLETGESCDGVINAINLACQDTIYIDLVEAGANIDFVEIAVTALNAATLSSLQWAFLYEGSVLSFADVEPGALNVDQSSFNEVSPGDLRFLWLDLGQPNVGVNFPNNTVLFTVKFNILSEGSTDVVIGADDLLFPEAVTPPLQYLCISSSPVNVITDGAIVSGTIKRSEDFSCSGVNPVPMENLLVEITNGTVSYVTMTDADGEFSRLVLPGDYTVTALPLNNVWSYCENDISISLPDLDSEVNVDFISYGNVLCPFMEVNVSIPFVRRCFNNTYTVNYCNQGTANAENASVVIELQDNLNFISSSHPDFTVDGQFITFNLGTVDFSCSSFTFVAYASCDAEPGETHCVFAEILPNDPCGRVLGDYVGPVIELNGYCDDDSVRVNISNVSSENMIMPELFIVVEEDVMLQADPFQLNALSSIDIALPAKGTTYWINANQPEGFPLADAASLSIEGCGVNEDGTINTGFLNNFSLGDYYPYLDVDCQENIGSYDPNDKHVFPNGFSEEDFIKNNQTLDFKIRFQNTGTDTAFKVVIEDVISPFLDITTIRRTSYSHSNTMRVTDRLVSFTFDNILLVDSLKNEPESHGYVSFSIDMLPDLADGIEIENNADIYFDFNDPIRTNTTHLLIGTDFIDEVSSINEIENSIALQVKVSPNPADKNTILNFEYTETGRLHFSLYDLRGNKLIQTNLNANEIDLSNYDLIPGQYFIRLLSEEGKRYLAKLMVH